MHGIYPNDASILDTAGRLLIFALFLIIGIRNLQKFHVDDHIARLTKFKAPLPRVTFWVGQTMEFVACAMVLLTRHAALGGILLSVFTGVGSLLLLAFWEVEVPPMRIGTQNGMVGNIAV